MEYTNLKKVLDLPQITDFSLRNLHCLAVHSLKVANPVSSPNGGLPGPLIVLSKLEQFS